MSINKPIKASSATQTTLPKPNLLTSIIWIPKASSAVVGGDGGQSGTDDHTDNGAAHAIAVAAAGVVDGAIGAGVNLHYQFTTIFLLNK